MAVFNHLPMGQEGLKEVYQWVDDFANTNNAISYKKVLGKSPDNWDIPAVFVTNRDIPDDDKQIAVVTLARSLSENRSLEILTTLCWG